MPATNVKTGWVDGDLYFYDKAGNEIFHIDGTNRKLVFASGAVLDVDAATAILSFAAGEIATADLAAGAVTKAKAAAFVSTEQTATGSSQNVAHGLGAVPAAVLVVPTEHPGTPDTGAFDIAEGSHDATNVVVTVTANVKFKVFAWA